MAQTPSESSVRTRLKHAQTALERLQQRQNALSAYSDATYHQLEASRAYLFALSNSSDALKEVCKCYEQEKNYEVHEFFAIFEEIISAHRVQSEHLKSLLVLPLKQFTHDQKQIEKLKDVSEAGQNVEQLCKEYDVRLRSNRRRVEKGDDVVDCSADIEARLTSAFQQLQKDLIERDSQLTMALEERLAVYLLSMRTFFAEGNCLFDEANRSLTETLQKVTTLKAKGKRSNSKRVLKTSATALSTPEGIILKQGYVGVKGKKSFDLRWMELHAMGQLKWFKSWKNSEAVGELSLRACIVRSIGKRVVSVITGATTVLMQLASDSELASWSAALQEVISSVGSMRELPGLRPSRNSLLLGGMRKPSELVSAPRPLSMSTPASMINFRAGNQHGALSEAVSPSSPAPCLPSSSSLSSTAMALRPQPSSWKSTKISIRQIGGQRGRGGPLSDSTAHGKGNVTNNDGEVDEEGPLLQPHNDQSPSKDAILSSTSSSQIAKVDYRPLRTSASVDSVVLRRSATTTTRQRRTNIIGTKRYTQAVTPSQQQALRVRASFSSEESLRFGDNAPISKSSRAGRCLSVRISESRLRTKSESDFEISGSRSDTANHSACEELHDLDNRQTPSTVSLENEGEKITTEYGNKKNDETVHQQQSVYSYRNGDINVEGDNQPDPKVRWLFYDCDASNRVCADCGQEDPTWADIAVVVLVCDACASLHRSLGSSVSNLKSLLLDDWLEEEVNIILETGNACSTAFWSHHVPVNRSAPSASSSRLEKARWVTDKYQWKIFMPLFTETLANLTKELFDCVLNHDVLGVISLLAQGLDVNFLDVPNQCRGLLHYAVLRNDAVMTQLLLHLHANVGITDVCGRTPLHYAVMCGAKRCAFLLLRSGAQPFEADDQLLTAVDYAQYMGERWLLQLIGHQDHKADENDEVLAEGRPRSSSAGMSYTRRLSSRPTSCSSELVSTIHSGEMAANNDRVGNYDVKQGNETLHSSPFQSRTSRESSDNDQVDESFVQRALSAVSAVSSLSDNSDRDEPRPDHDMESFSLSDSDDSDCGHQLS